MSNKTDGCVRVTFGRLWSGDRFDQGDGITWTKLTPSTARRHSPRSVSLREQGHGYIGDAVRSFERDTPVNFVPPGTEVVWEPSLEEPPATTRCRVVEEVSVIYEVDIPDNIVGDDAREEYVCENQPPRREWSENVVERTIEPLDIEEMTFSAAPYPGEPGGD